MTAGAALGALDPDVCYGNVEVMAARHVGQETVTDVANIDKDLFAFRSVLALQGLRDGGDGR